MTDLNRAGLWKLTAIGLVVVAATAVVTGLVVANRTAPKQEARVETPSAAPSAVVTPSTPPVAQAPAPTPTPPATETPRSSVPTREAINACNRQASAQAGSAPREGKDKYIDVAKDAGIGALGGAAVGALGGAAVKGGKGAGKGALIGGALGAGGGTLYGIWDNKKNDEHYRAAYGACMKSRGYAG
ncbi:MAG: hypothetical protein E6K82_14115 [Candidatus Rokuibacteriota bacterium]|nr:MAG: hypothetical protein E6K82_14115 [Candidatus Rokubacteria bacterium]